MSRAVRESCTALDKGTQLTGQEGAQMQTTTHLPTTGPGTWFHLPGVRGAFSHLPKVLYGLVLTTENSGEKGHTYFNIILIYTSM